MYVHKGIHIHTYAYTYMHIYGCVFVFVFISYLDHSPSLIIQSHFDNIVVYLGPNGALGTDNMGGCYVGGNP